MDVDWSIKMKSPRNHKWIRNMFFICLLAVFACVILFHFISVTQNIQFEPEKQTQLSDAWMLNGTQTISFPAELTAKKGEPLVLSCKLPEDISENDALFFNASYCSQKVYVDGEEIYHFADTPQLPFSNTFGSAYALVDLLPEYAGKTLTIQMTSPYDELSYDMTGIYFGDKGEFKFALLRNSMWRYAIFHLFSFIALTSLIFGIYILLNKLLVNLGISFVYFSVLVFSMGIWIFCDPSIMQFYTADSAIVQFLSLFSLLFIGSSYMGLCACFMPKQHRIFRALELIGYALVLFQIVLYLMNHFNSTFFILGVVVYAIAYLAISTISFLRHYKEYDFSKFLILGIFILFIGVCVTAVQFFQDPSGTRAVIAFTLSFAIYITCLFMIIAKESVKIIRNSVQSDMYEHMAFTDQLTNIPNRAAFDRALDALEKKDTPSGEVILFICDLNYLKKTNDEMGHHMGDKLIQQAARCLVKTFQGHATVYRLGGDEFAIPLINPRGSVSEFLNRLDKNMREYNNVSTLTLSIAIGYAKRPLPLTTDATEIDIFREADANMYESKKKMHAQRIDSPMY